MWVDAVVSKVRLSAVASVAWPCVLGRGGSRLPLGLDGGAFEGHSTAGWFPLQVAQRRPYLQ